MIQYSIARKEHLPGILSLYKQLQPDEKPLAMDEADKIWEKGNQQGITYFVATDGDRVISTLYLVIMPNMTRGGRSNGLIENVVTHEEYRRKGIGKKLMQMAIDYGKAKNCYKIVLLSNIKRKESHLFYESCGFNGDSKRGYEMRL